MFSFLKEYFYSKEAREICARQNIKIFSHPLPGGKKLKAKWVESRLAEIINDHRDCATVIKKVRATESALQSAGFPVSLDKYFY